MDENNSPTESSTPSSSTPFDRDSIHASQNPGSEEAVSEETIAPTIQNASDEIAGERLPESIKIAGGLLIAHGACLALNGFLYGRQSNDHSSLVGGLMWFGCTFVLCGALYERKLWAWWIVTLLGGGMGVINLLSSLGPSLSRILLRGEESLGVSFILPVIFIAAIVMLISVTLLLTPSAKAAFGINKVNSGGSL
jgi:hypothetical protein